MSKEEITDIIEKDVIIRMRDVPNHMAGIELGWLDNEVKKIKERLERDLFKLLELKKENK